MECQKGIEHRSHWNVFTGTKLFFCDFSKFVGFFSGMTYDKHIKNDMSLILFDYMRYIVYNLMCR